MSARHMPGLLTYLPGFQYSCHLWTIIIAFTFLHFSHALFKMFLTLTPTFLGILHGFAILWHSKVLFTWKLKCFQKGSNNNLVRAFQFMDFSEIKVWIWFLPTKKVIVDLHKHWRSFKKGVLFLGLLKWNYKRSLKISYSFTYFTANICWALHFARLFSVLE